MQAIALWQAGVLRELLAHDPVRDGARYRAAVVVPEWLAFAVVARQAPDQALELDVGELVARRQMNDVVGRQPLRRQGDDQALGRRPVADRVHRGAGGEEIEAQRRLAE